MPRYVYSAKTQPDKITKGNVEAESEQDAINKLAKLGYFPISIQVESESLKKQGGIMRPARVPSRDFVIFTRQLATLIESGVNILNGLRIVNNQTSNKYFKSIISDVSDKIKDGSSLSVSMSTHPSVFSGLYTAMIHSGEVGGNMDVALKRLAEFLEKEEEFKSSIRQALVYPAFILAVSVLTIVVLLGFVVPRLVSMFRDMGQILPLPTKILINISAGLRVYWWLIIAVVGLVIFSLKRLKLEPQTKLALDKFKLKAAVWGNIVLKTEIGRLTRTLSLLLSSGIPIVYALDISKSVLSNAVLKQEIDHFKDKITDGTSFSRCLRESSFFPAFVTDIVAIGEETGSIDKSLLRVADDFEREVERSLKAMTRLLEPVIILLMGLVVGFIVVSMLLPIFQINLIVR